MFWLILIVALPAVECEVDGAWRSADGRSAMVCDGVPGVFVPEADYRELRLAPNLRESLAVAEAQIESLRASLDASESAIENLNLALAASSSAAKDLLTYNRELSRRLERAGVFSALERVVWVAVTVAAVVGIVYAVVPARE